MKHMLIFLSLLAVVALLCGCTPTAVETSVIDTEVEKTEPTQLPAAVPPETTQPTVPPDPILELLDSMTAEEKVGQLFLARCPNQEALEDIQQYHLGGYILFGRDFENQTPETITETIAEYQDAADIPLLIAVDEEGGTVCRVSSNRAFRASQFPSPRTLYQQGGMEAVLDAEYEKAELLSSLGINVNMAPVCDITTNSNSFMYRRSLGEEPEVVGEFVCGASDCMAENNVGAVLKHFPGYGNNTDTHSGIAIDSRSLEELENRDLIPFQMGIENGVNAILVSHTIVEAFEDEEPASLSPAVHTYIRLALGFQGVIVTDDLVMEAITQQYGVGESAVLAVLAGNDLLCSTQYREQYDAVLEAAEEGRIPMEQLDRSAERVLRWKDSLGLLS